MYDLLIKGDKEALPVVQMESIFKSEVFSGELEAMSGAFYTIMFKWLNLAYIVYDDQNKIDERGIVKDFAMHVLNHGELVHSVWNQIENNNIPVMFDQILKRPDKDWNSFFALTVRLCGKNSYRLKYAEKMFDYLEENKISKDGQSVMLLIESLYETTELVQNLENQRLQAE